uniref:Uncharacterized protein n=1 Tax=Mastacembelus armatus TaxID=205130 RepID=A0A3Q3MDQ9_9TELE
QHYRHVSYLYCFLFFRSASRRASWFFFLLFSLLDVLACGFSLVRFLTNSLRSVRPAWKIEHVITSCDNMQTAQE